MRSSDQTLTLPTDSVANNRPVSGLFVYKDRVSDPYHDFNRSRNALYPRVSSLHLRKDPRNVIPLNHSYPLIQVIIRHEVFLPSFDAVDQHRTRVLLSLILITALMRLAMLNVVAVLSLMARGGLPSVNAVLMSCASPILRIFRRMIERLMTSDSRTSVHADIVVITFNDHLVSTMTLVVRMLVMMMVVMVTSRVSRMTAKTIILLCRSHLIPSKVPPVVMVVVVLMMVMMARVGQRRSPADVNVIDLAFNSNSIVGALPAMMIVMITVMMVVVTVAGIRRTTAQSDVAVHPVDVNVKSRPRSSLCRLLCSRFGRWAMFMRLMRHMMRIITPR